jgi:site-specific recombinase XerD
MLVSHLNTRKSKSSNSKANIFLRLTLNGKRKEISLKRSVESEEWDPQKCLVKGNSLKARELNNYLRNEEARAYSIYNVLRSSNEDVCLDELKNQFLGKKEDGKEFLAVYQQHNNEIKDLVGKTYSDGTYKRYLVSYRKFQAFMRFKGLESLSLQDVSKPIFFQYEHYLKHNEGLEQNTAVKYLKHLKKIVKYGYERGWVGENSLQGTKLKSKPVPIRYLTLQELNAVQAVNCSTDRLNEVKDWFVFSCYTGLAYSDLAKLTTDDIKQGKDGTTYIEILRKKTNERSCIPILPMVEDLIIKYAMHPCRLIKKQILPVRSNQKLNEYLKEIAALAGIKKELSTHVGRHTFATTVTLANDVPISSLKHMLGHRSIKTTEIYGKVVDSKVIANMQTLATKLDKQFNVE